MHIRESFMRICMETTWCEWPLEKTLQFTPSAQLLSSARAVHSANWALASASSAILTSTTSTIPSVRSVSLRSATTSTLHFFLNHVLSLKSVVWNALLPRCAPNATSFCITCSSEANASLNQATTSTPYQSPPLALKSAAPNAATTSSASIAQPLSITSSTTPLATLANATTPPFSNKPQLDKPAFA